jgi:uncharacterized protein
VSWATLGVAAGLAVLGEVRAFVLGAGSRRAGGSTQAAGLAIVGSLIGGILGTALPVPMVGTLIGACLGAFIGSLLGDLWAGRPLFPSFEAGWGAAVGRFWGTVSKLAIGGIMLVMLTLAAFFCLPELALQLLLTCIGSVALVPPSQATAILPPHHDPHQHCEGDA